MRYLLALGIVLMTASFAPAARQTTVTSSGKEVVAHSRMAPVVVHRVFPPYGLGKHVYTPRGK
jgi:hypothetical protein